MPKRAASKSSETNKKGKVEPVDEEAIFAETMEKVDIKKIMESEGAVVKCVLLKKDGTKEELSLNMSPKLGKVQETLGGSISFLGQWEDIGAVAVVSSTASEEESNRNVHKLQPPLHNREAFGDILVIRYNEDGVEEDLTLAEYDDFAKKDIEEWEPEVESEESEEEESENDEDEEMQLVNIATLQNRLTAAFKEANNREPTEEELEDLLMALFQRAEGDQGSDDEEEFEEIGDSEEDASEEDEEDEPHYGRG